MLETPSEIGARAEREIAHALLGAGWIVYLPVFAPHARVDMVALKDDRVLRLQCKTARILGGVLEFRTCSNTNNVPKAYTGEVDAFGAYSPDLGRSYLVPLEGLGESGCYLRLGPTKNNQSKGVRYAADYEIKPA